MNRAHSTVAGYLGDYLRHEQITDPSPWVESSLAERIEQAASQIEGDRLKPVFEALGGEVSYEDIRIVVTCQRNRELSPP